MASFKNTMLQVTSLLVKATLLLWVLAQWYVVIILQSFRTNTTQGLMYMDITLWFAVLKYFPKFRRWATPVGLVVVCLALGLGSLSTSVTHLIVTQGILYALGGGLAVVGEKTWLCLWSRHGGSWTEWSHSPPHTRMAPTLVRVPDNSTSMCAQLCGTQLSNRLLLQASSSAVTNIAI
jgi:hypothetical protein